MRSGSERFSRRASSSACGRSSRSRRAPCPISSGTSKSREIWPRPADTRPSRAFRMLAAPPRIRCCSPLAFRGAPEGSALLGAKVINLALFVLAGLAGAQLARRLWGDDAGLWTAAILAFLPRSVLMADLLAAENLLAPLLLGYLLMSAASWTREFSATRAAGLGLLAGSLCLTRAVFYFVPLVWLAGALAGRLGGKRIVRELLLILVVAHAVLLPWAIRNGRVFGRSTPFNLVGGVGALHRQQPERDRAVVRVVRRSRAAAPRSPRPRRCRHRRRGPRRGLALDPRASGRGRSRVPPSPGHRPERRRLRRGVRDLRQIHPAPRRAARGPARRPRAGATSRPRACRSEDLRRAPGRRRARRLLAARRAARERDRSATASSPRVSSRPPSTSRSSRRSWPSTAATAGPRRM